MIRVIFGLKCGNHINMQDLKRKIDMMQVNQMAVYHTIIECNNVLRHSASDQIKLKWTDVNKKIYFLCPLCHCQSKTSVKRGGITLGACEEYLRKTWGPSR